MDPRGKRNLPGSDAEYTIELLPAQCYSTCISSDNRSMIDARTGTFLVRSTGFARGARRSIIATSRRRGFLDSLYYTDLETSNPATYKIQTGGHPILSATVTPRNPQAWASPTQNWTRPWPGPLGRDLERARRRPHRLQQPRGRNVSFGCTEINFISGDAVDGPLHTNDQLLSCGSPRAQLPRPRSDRLARHPPDRAGPGAVRDAPVRS